ncbi:MAG: LysM peptidoglycan-binding domain-containing protein [Anaerolineaceae bacterium]|nr:MAG: LysM peptidoglycan-binding domain-containing protein [Anaerolineaceae bacterium]
MNILKKAGVFIASIMLSLTLFSSYAYAADYTIVPNDSLYQIGLLFKTSANALKSDNKLSSNMIFPGQKIKVPAEVYTIKSGDTLFLIASKHSISLADLRKANNKWDNLIIPGQKLLLPGIKPTGSQTGSSQNPSASSSGSSTGSGTVISYKNSEVDLLARLITAEAIGEPYDAMVAVGAVVVNRVKSPDWPNSISAVINHVSAGHYQFSPVQNGFINKPASDATIRAAWAALYGADPSRGAMFYYDNSSTNQWIRSKPVTARIGNMIFAK